MPSSPANQDGGFYDADEQVSAYLKHRHTPISSPNLVMEDPAFTTAIQDLQGKRILDLGSGDGTFAQSCLDAGCTSYLGVDSSLTMIQRARNAIADERACFAHLAIEQLAPTTMPVDIVTSRMALHYLSKLRPTFTAIRSSLTSGGQFLFTVVHPVMTAAHELPNGKRQSQIVTDYFSPGPRNRHWFDASVTWYHRTIEHYVQDLIATGFQVNALSECAPDRTKFDDDDLEYSRRQHVPVFLLLSATPSRQN